MKYTIDDSSVIFVIHNLTAHNLSVQTIEAYITHREKKHIQYDFQK